MNTSRSFLLLAFIMLGGISASRAQTDSTLSMSTYGWHFRTPYSTGLFPELPPSLGMIGDTLTSPLGLIETKFQKIEQTATVAEDWSKITIVETVDGKIQTIPVTAPLDWYFNTMLQKKGQVGFSAAMQGKGEPATKTDTKRKTGSLELVGVDVGDLGRVSLRVRGNVNISGKMVFQDQQILASNYGETQNTHIEFDQKQNLNIEGKIGDRITVAMDQDSERDFDWENNIRITYDGEEDEIVQRIEAGNISLSLPATQYVTFSGKNQGLFGLKAISKLGPVDITTIASVEQTRKEKQSYKGSSEATTQQIKDYQYRDNQYFFIHPWYRNGVPDTSIYNGTDFNDLYIPSYYPVNEKGLHEFNPGITIKDFELYRGVSTTTPGSVTGIAHYDLDNPDAYEYELRVFDRMERDVDYTIYEDFGYIRLTIPSDDIVLACSFNLVELDSNGAVIDTIKTFGTEAVAGDTATFQLIKYQTNNPSQPTWDLMWKNVYYLGTTNINPEGFAVRVMNDVVSPASERDSTGTNYLELFGLDIFDENADHNPDELIDVGNVPNVHMVYGELIFPSFHPFVHSKNDSDGNTNDQLSTQLGQGMMYSSTNINDIQRDKRYLIEVDYTNTSSNINLGFMIVEGSEEVKVGGVTKQRNIDYQIDYFSGTLTFLMDPTELANADVEVLFEKHELVSFDKKTIIGTRAQMDFGQNSFIGATALYYNQSVLNEKIEVGYEPTRNFIWDINGRYTTDLAGMTRFIDRLPLLETEAMSSVSVEGEFAQVLPNPNPVNNPATGDDNGVAYVDDFEGAKRTTAPQIQRRYWKASSAPLDPFTGEPISQNNRADLSWYNPFYPYVTTDIWPNLSTSNMAGNETTDILRLDIEHTANQVFTPHDSIWAAVTTPLFSGDYDQTDSKFFEIWLNGTEGVLTVDLGRISEDWNGNGILDTEDKPDKDANMDFGNGLLEDKEDVGLDGCEDDYEDGWGGCLPEGSPTFSELLADGETVLINPMADPDDPNGDNFKAYTKSNLNPDGVNGTEGNRNDNSGFYPDTEDLDGSGFLDRTNDYYSKTFSLDPNSLDADYLAGETAYDDGTPTGWRLYRIPLSHFSKIDTTGGIGWNDIRHMRLTVTGTDSQAVLKIAKIEMVGNEWQELGILAGDTTVYTDDDSAFAITVINTEDNSDYKPPKGVKGEYDQINEIEAKEQSLVMQFNDLPPGYSGVAEKTLMELSGDKAQSYLTYDFMKMYVYGASPWIDYDTTEIEFFMQFGRGEEFYEIRQPVYDGWDEDEGRNSIKIDLNWLTALKLADSSTVDLLNPNDTFMDSTNLKRYTFSGDSGNNSNKIISIQGKPSLSRIQFMRMGVRNRSGLPATGEVWVDELRLSGVKKDRGIAMRMQTNLTLADFGKVTVAYSRKDADFHVLQNRLGSNNTSEDFRVNASATLSRFLPKSWGLKIPVSTTFANSRQTPKYHPGTDVLVDENAVPDSIMTLNQSVSFSTSIKKTSASDRKIVKYTLDKISTSFSAKRSESSNYTTTSNKSEDYSGKIGYSLPFGKDNYISPLKWMEGVPLVGKKLSEFHLYYTPESFNANMSFSEKLNEKQPRVGNRTETYNLGLTRNYTLSYKLSETVKKIQYSKNMASDMDHYRGYTWMAIRDLDPGILTNSTENFSVAYTPALLEWLKPNFNYSAAYRWSKPLNSTVDGANIGTNLKFSSNLVLSPTKLVELVYKPPARSGRGTSGRVRGAKQNPGQEKSAEPQKKKFSFMGRIHGFTKKINPINFRYSSTLGRTGQGVLGTVPTGYKFGWLPEHGLDHDPSVGTNTGNWDYNRDLSLNSGVKISNSVSTTMSFSQKTSLKRSGTGVETMTLTRDALPYGEFLENKLPMPGWSLRWSGLQKLPLINKVAKNVSLEHGFRGSEVYSWQFDADSPGNIPLLSPGSFIEDNKEAERNSKVTANFSPLVGLTMQFDKGISTNARFNYSRSLDTKETGRTLKTDKSFTSTANYSHKGGINIPIPFMKDVDIQNNINFTLNFDYNDSKTKVNNAGAAKFSTTNAMSSWKAGLRISYSFTQRVSGGVVYEYRETDNKTTGRKIDRDFGFDVNISISG